MKATTVGRTRWPRPAIEYERFIEDLGIPIHRGLGVRNCRDLALGDCAAIGGRAAAGELAGLGGVPGLLLVEVPGGGALKAERHLYEEIFYVLEGRGATEVWTASEPTPSVFEWQTNSIFSVPLNSWHRVVNTSREPALILTANNAPPIMELIRDRSFIFGCDYDFPDRFKSQPGYFDGDLVLGEEELSLRAIYRGALVPDALNCKLPLDGQRGIGHRHFYLQLAGNYSTGFLAQYPPGRYSKTHSHPSGPVLFCVAGEGYTLTWPRTAGTTPWRDGHGDKVLRQDYVPGGLVSAAPGGADWFHAHFCTSPDGLRVMALLGGYPPRVFGKPGDEVIAMNEDVNLGGNTIEYPDEDPMVRKIFREALVRHAVPFDMPESTYVRP